MKRNKWNRLICLSISAIMLFGVSFTGKYKVTAAGNYDCTLTITAPRPGETPQQPVGCCLKNNC